MKPTSTAHILRSIIKELGGDLRVDAQGFLLDKPAFPRTDQKTDDFCRDYFLYNLARKREWKDGATTTQMRNALTKWMVSEQRCRVINLCGRYFTPLQPQQAVFSKLEQLTTANLSRLLMDRWPDFSDLRFTGGATTETPRKWAWAVSKYSGMPLFPEGNGPSYKCVPAAQDVLSDALEQNPGLARRYMRARDKLTIDTPLNVDVDRKACDDLAVWLCQHTPVGRLDYVSKNIEEVRLIIKGEAFTVAIQKIFGDVIRDALKDVGIDLNDQVPNQEWAEIGSLTGLVATVDLSSASDSIALRTLRYFPPRWQEYVMCTRDTHVSAGSSNAKKLEMVAGMGNGLIFELESALFWAFSLAVCQYLNLDTSWVSVYGDDIIIPSAGTQLLEEFLAYNGFELNRSKSFTGQDPFRESCGKHFHNGVDVTPVYVKGDLNCNSELYRLINELASWSSRTGMPLDKSLALLLNHIPRADRNVVPLTWGTTSGLHYALDDTCKLPVNRWNRAYQRYEVVWTAWVDSFIDLTERLPVQTQLVAALQSLENGEELDLRCYIRKLPSYLKWRQHELFGGHTSVLFEAQRASVTWLREDGARPKQQRGETLVRDA